MSFLPIVLSLLISCGEVEKKTAIFLNVQTETDVDVHEYADRVWIYIDPHKMDHLPILLATHMKRVYFKRALYTNIFWKLQNRR